MTNESKSLLIGMLIGDGTISNNYVFKMMHCEKQLGYLQYKVDLLNKCGIKNNGIKTYIQKVGYKIGVPVYYTQLSINPFIKHLRNSIYTPKKKIGDIDVLAHLTPREIAIWFMDDGHINIRYKSNKTGIIGFYIKIATCVCKEEAQVIIDYFKECWNISFYTFKEGNGFSLCCGTKEGLKFIDIISPFVPECMRYKITYNKDWEAPKMLFVESSDSKQETPAEMLDEDIVWTV